MRVYTGCTDVRDDFSALLDGELAQDEREAVESHLSDCAECLRALDGLKRVDTLFRKLPQVPAPNGFDARLKDARKPALLPFPKSLPSLNRMAPFLAAAAVLMIVAGISLVTLQGDDASPVDTMAQRSAPDPSPPQMNAVPPNELGADQLEQYVADSAAAPMQAPEPEVAMSQPEDEVFSERIFEAQRENTPAGAGASRSDEQDIAQDNARDDAPERQFSQRPRAEALSTDGKEISSDAPAPPPAPAPMPAATPPAVAQKSATTSDQDAAAEQLEVAREMPAPAEPTAQSEPAMAYRKMEEQQANPRKVQRIGDAWFENGYTDQPLTDIARASDRFKEMLAADDSLRRHLELNDPVVFQFKEQWYRLAPVARVR